MIFSSSLAAKVARSYPIECEKSIYNFMLASYSQRLSHDKGMRCVQDGSPLE